MNNEPQTAAEVRALAVQVYRKHQAAFRVRKSYPQPTPILLTHVEPPLPEPAFASAIMTLVKGSPARPSLPSILEAVGAVTRISVRELVSPIRDRRLVRARFVYFWVARTLTTKSILQIGKYCGGRDHSTVLSGLHQVERDLAQYEERIAAVSLCISGGSVYGATENHDNLSLRGGRGKK